MSLEIFQLRVLPTKDKLYRFALRIMRDEEEAKDIVQEVMIKVWNRRESIDSLNNMEAWCMQITKNLCYDKIKSKSYQTNVSIPENWQVADSKDTPVHSTERSDIMNQIHQLINGLPDKQKLVMQLRDIEGLSYKEISAAMEIDLNQVKVNLFRARKTVRDHLVNINAYGL
jgi:RNA polymerase sigma-70 factor (ECF subfamily)